MAESFNPYRDWLGIASGQRPTTHYGLFGLKPLESDAAVIRKAISRLVARLREIQPGNRKRELQEIVKEISAAKACLTDPAAKAAYDAQLRASRGSKPAASPQAKGVSPSTTKGKQPAPARPQRTVQPPKASPPTKDAPRVATPPAGSPGVPPAPPPVWECPPDAVGPAPDYGHSQGYQGDAPAIWECPADAGVPASQGDSPAVWECPSEAVSPAPAHRPPQRHEADRPPVVGAAQGHRDVPPAAAPPVAPPPAAVAFPAPAPPAAAAYPPEEMSFTPDPEANQIAIPVDVFWDPNAEEVPERSWTIVGLMITFLFALVLVLASLIGFLTFQRYMNATNARTRQSDQAQLAKPAAVLPRKVAADPGKAAEEAARKKAGFEKNLAELVAALAKRDLAGVPAIVAEARANAQSPDDQKVVDKYEKLSTDVREFLAIIAARVSKFQPSEEVALGKTRITVVDARGGRFSFRYGSKIFNSTVETLPTWLVVALADGNLPDDGRSKELYGAFLAVDPDGDRARAQSLWSEAAKSGIKIDQLLPSLDALPATEGQ